MDEQTPGPDRRPASRRIADELRAAVQTGRLAEGDQLPSERELATQYGAARNTAREAIRILSEDGLVVVEHGRGAFVRSSRPLIRLGSDRYSHKYRGQSPFLLECAKQGKAGRFQVLSIDRVEASPDVASRLDLKTPNSNVVRRENVFWADDDPVYRVTTWVPWNIAEGSGLLDEEVGHPYGIHGIFEDRGHVMTRIKEEVSARMPSPEEREYLRLKSGVPVINALHLSIDQNRLPYELTRFIMRADLTGLVYDIPVE